MSHTVRHHLVSYFTASLNQQWGYTPLLRAVAGGHADVVRFLLECGGDILGQTKVSVSEQRYVLLHLVLYCKFLVTCAH